MYNVVNLGNVITVHPSFDPHPGPSLQRCCVLKHTQHIRHLSDRYHQLLPLPNTQVPNVLDSLLDVLLFEGFDVHIALYAFFGNYTLDLERLRNERSIVYVYVGIWCVCVCVSYCVTKLHLNKLLH